MTGDPQGWSEEEIARRIAIDIPSGSYVNLGIGLPERVSQFVPAESQVVYHSENGLLGMGPAADPARADPDLINAGKKKVTVLPGAAYFHQADSFAMVRGGHIDICILGGMQVSIDGDLANWSTGDADAIPAVGGAMDLVVGAKRVFIAMRHTTKAGGPKIVTACTYPLTGKGVVERIYTDLAVMSVTEAGIRIVELAPGIDFDFVQSRTGVPLRDEAP